MCFKIFKGVIVYGKVDVKESAVGREMRIQTVERTKYFRTINSESRRRTVFRIL